MRNCNEFVKRILAPLFCICLMLNAVLPLMAEAEELHKTVYIRNEKDWVQFVQNCRLDSWSEGITVSLEADLNVEGCEPVPTFGGTFNGNNHVIKGLHLDGEGDVQGLFRYIRENAMVKNLSVYGAVTPSGNPEKTGGLAGQNSGTLLNCHFLGVVSGKTSVGGLVGVNTVSGHMENCEMVSGAISGEHFVGGVAGENYGSMVHCTNHAQVNIEAVEPVPQLKDFDWEKLNNTENIPTSTDVGGIAGYSQGLLQHCVNNGPVGYPHVGYNIGGIVGRQSGMMTDCINNSVVKGRKDVGGIAGQAEPFTELQYEESTLQKLGKELENLSSLMNSALNSTDSTREGLSGHISSITGFTNDAEESVSGLLDGFAEMGDDAIDTINDLSVRVQDFIKDLSKSADHMHDAGKRFAQGMKQLRAAIEEACKGHESMEGVLEEFDQAAKVLKDTFRELLARIPEPLSGDVRRLTIADIRDMIEQIGEDLSDMSQIIQNNLEFAMDGLKEAVKHVKEAIRHAGGDTGSIDEALGMVEEAVDDIAHGVSHISKALKSIKEALKDQADLPALELPKLPDDFHDQKNDLGEALRDLNHEIEEMNQTANRGGQLLSQHLKEVNQQFNAVTEVIRSAGEAEGDRELIVDISEEEAADTTWGKIQKCRNEGAVEGDVNIGGIAGSMAIEYDFDPEDDVLKKGDMSLNFKYFTRAILLNCENKGDIESKKDCAGGIVGRMDLGVVMGVRSYGSVKSTSGERTGGIAGLSSSLIQDSWAKCDLSGSRRVGGIAGEGHDIKNCRTLVDIQDAASYMGAIAGETDGVLENNMFVSERLGGVDGISYEGSAQPVSYETLTKEEHIPREFSELTVTFWADDEFIRTLHVNYGEKVDPKQIPKVPEREGFYGYWSDFDQEQLLFNAQVEAIYVPWLTAAASEDGRILAEGDFRPETTLQVKERTDLRSPVDPEKNLGMYHISLPDGDQKFTAVRIAIPEGEQFAELWTMDRDENWTRLDTTQEGSYLRAEIEGSEVVLCMASVAGRQIMWYCIAAGAAVLVLILILVFIRKRKKNGKKKTK